MWQLTGRNMLIETSRIASQGMIQSLKDQDERLIPDSPDEREPLKLGKDINRVRYHEWKGREVEKNLGDRVAKLITGWRV
jgi:hypothetical protein